MKALIFAAGLGSRLRPLTDTLPKAMVRVGGVTMLERVALKLRDAGVGDIVVNVHHHGEVLKEYISGLDIPGVSFRVSDEGRRLLDTGGGLKKAATLIKGDEPFIIHNVDVLSDVDITDMLAFHKKNRPLATLAVSNRTTSRYFLWQKGMLAGWENTKSGERIVCRDGQLASLEVLAFSGIHIVEPDIFSLVEEEGVFPLNSLYLRLAPSHKIIAYRHDHSFWADIGSREKLKKAEEMLAENPGKFGRQGK